MPLRTPYAREIAWLEAEGISTGWAGGTCRPLDPMNRDATAACRYRPREEQDITFFSRSD